MMYFYTKQQEGFSLVETLVAITILLIAIVGPMSISARTAKSSTYATEQIQAFYLAQEGLELAQKVRDDFMLQQFRTTLPVVSTWTSFKGSAVYQNCINGAGCGLMWDNTIEGVVTPVACSTPGACTLSLTSDDTKRSRFAHGAVGVAASSFTRKIYFDTTGLDDSREVKVRSVVTWRTGSIVADQMVEVNTYLYNTYASP